MSVRRRSACTALLSLVVFALLASMAALSWATGGTVLCVKPGSAVRAADSNGTCPPPYEAALLGAEGKEGKQGPEGKEGKVPLSGEELATLKGILPCIKSVSKGIDGKPTVQFSGCNVQIVNGVGECEAGKLPLSCGTRSENGEGNLVIGYDEHPGEQTGSHNLILGEYQTFTSYGGIDAGVFNKITGPFATITGGGTNEATSQYDSVSGGADNISSGYSTWVGGGVLNKASGYYASVTGGIENAASGQDASVTGGKRNVARGTQTTFADGKEAASVDGGLENHSEGKFSAIFGGNALTATGEFEAIP